MAVHGNASHILMADYDSDTAAHAAKRINELTNSQIATSAQIDVRDVPALAELLTDVDVCLFGVPFEFLMDCTQAAIESRTSMVDFGGHTDTVLKQLALNDKAREKQICIVPDCGMGPGLNNTMGVYTIEQLQARGAIPREVRLWDGGLPQKPDNVWGYRCAFHINGLTNEYDGQALCLRDGKVVEVDTLTELEEIEFDDIGVLEAFVTSGGTSTVPYTYKGVLQVYDNKTCRYPGHYAQFKAFKDLGLFKEEPIEIAPGTPPVNPRQFYHTLLAPHIESERVIDVCVMRARGTGEKDGQDISLTVDLIDLDFR